MRINILEPDFQGFFSLLRSQRLRREKSRENPPRVGKFLENFPDRGKVQGNLLKTEVPKANSNSEYYVVILRFLKFGRTGVAPFYENPCVTAVPS